MDAKRHARAKEVYFEAVELSAGERASCLDHACGDDDELRHEVESLLAHHSPVSLLGDMPAENAAHQDGVVVPGSPSANGSWSLGRLFSSHKARLIWTLAAAVILIVIGFVTHSRIERALLGIRADELTTVLDAGIQALDLWIVDQRQELDFLTGDPRFVELVEELLAAGEGADDEVEAWNRSPARQGLLEMESYFTMTSGAAGVAIMNQRGVIVYSINEYETGLLLDERLSPQLSAAISGRKVFVHPHRYEDLVRRQVGGTMYSFVLGPLRDTDGRVNAAVANMQMAYGPGSISSILEVARLGDTGETYAFDEHGLMLSESRFTEELRHIGMAPPTEGQGEEWNARSQLNVQVRDPGGDLVRGHVPELEDSARPPTRLAAFAIAARGKTDPGELRGIVLEPYRNYRGVEVIGAWQWLREPGFAVVTEIEADEAFVPLSHVETIFGLLFVLLSVFVLFTLLSTFSVARLRSRVRELKELGPYRLVSPIAEGGMGVVYLAEHALMKRRTAIKVLSGELSKQNIARFEREVSLASGLTHPNTIEIYDYGRTPGGVFYYAMEYVEGPTLSELVTQFGPQPPERAVHILKQVCGSLGEAHREGLVHRDIKPQNIMLCVRGGERDVIKVLDFGLVKDVARAAPDELSKGIHIGGTPLYMAPERVTSPKHVDARVDIYSLGCVAYYLLAGRPIFEPEGGLDMLDKIVNGTPRPLGEVCTKAVPRELDDLVVDCLARDPEDRPGSVFELIGRLEAVSGVGSWTQDDATRWWEETYHRGREPRIGGD